MRCIQCYITLGWKGLPGTNTLAIGPILKLQSVVMMILGAIFTTLHFICNLQISPICCSVIHHAGKAYQGQIHQLNGPILKLQRKCRHGLYSQHLLALATFGGSTQIGLFLFVSLGHGKRGRQYRIAIDKGNQQLNF